MMKIYLSIKAFDIYRFEKKANNCLLKLEISWNKGQKYFISVLNIIGTINASDSK